MNRILVLIAGAAIIFLYIPIVTVIVLSFNAAESGATWTGFTLGWYAAILVDEPLLHSLWNSLYVSLLSATFSLIIGVLTSLSLTYFHVFAKRGILFALTLPLVIPETVLGAALLTIFSRTGGIGYPALILGNMILSVPLTTLITLTGFTTLDPLLPEAAADLGSGPLNTVVHVLLPLVRTSIVAAWLLAFTTAFSNIVISTFLSGVGTTTMPLYVYSLLKTGVSPEINALGSILLGLTILLTLLIGSKQVHTIVTSTRSHL